MIWMLISIRNISLSLCVSIVYMCYKGDIQILDCYWDIVLAESKDSNVDGI